MIVAGGRISRSASHSSGVLLPILGTVRRPGCCLLIFLRSREVVLFSKGEPLFFDALLVERLGESREWAWLVGMVSVIDSG